MNYQLYDQNTEASKAYRQHPWFALKVNTRSEDLACRALSNRGYEVFSPTFPERRRYTDRFKVVDTPILAGYVLIRWEENSKVPILSCPAVQNFVSFGGRPEPVPERTVADIGRMLNNGGRPVPYLTVGRRVRVETGVLAGIEGTYLRQANGGQLVISVDMIQRSVALQIDEDHVRPLE